MRAYVINLKRRSDRRAHVEKVLPAGLDVVFTTDWEGPLDGQQIDHESLRGFGLFPWQIVSKNIWWSEPLTKGDIGCAISHWRCWKDAREQNLDRAIFFEDDITLDKSFQEKLSHALHLLDTQHEGWDLLYLGR